MCLTWLDPPSTRIHRDAFFVASTMRIPLKLYTNLPWGIVRSAEKMTYIDLGEMAEVQINYFSFFALFYPFRQSPTNMSMDIPRGETLCVQRCT